ncbi:MAG: hypothetical protein AAF193_05460, partial [Bacteroidota bacterium]
MMYLVLTAMLALNVQREILDAFVLIDEGLVNTAGINESRNNALWSKFEFAHDLDPQKSKPYFESAQKIKDSSQDIQEIIDSLSTLLISETEGLTWAEADTIHLEYVQKKDQYLESTQIMVGSNDEISNGQAKVLKEQLLDLETTIQKELSSNGIQVTSKLFDFED